MAIGTIDLLGLDSLLSEEEELIRSSVRSFVSQEIDPIIAACYEEGNFPITIIPRLGMLGLLGSNLPEQYDCAGINNISYGIIMQELEAGDSGIRSFASVQGSLCMYPIYKFGSEDQRRHYLPKMAKGELIGCFGLTEPNFGSNPADMITRATKVDGGWLLNGSKAWITNASIADLAIVWAKVGEEPRDIRGFIVEKNTQGFSTRETKHKLSLRASITGELFFTDCFVPEEKILPEAIGLKGPLSCLTQARYGIAWGSVGAAMRCFQIALQYSNERIQFGKPISSFQLTQSKLTQMALEITKAQLICFRLGKLKDEGMLQPYQVSVGKLNNVSTALECARTSRGILGANGIMSEYSIMRHMANLESVYTYEGTHEIHTLIIGQHLTGQSAFQ